MSQSHNDFFPPSVTVTAPLGYEWDGFSKVTVWGSNESIHSLAKWFRKQFGDDKSRYREEDQGYGDDSFVAYLSDAKGNKTSSICMVVTDDESDALDGLRSYVASKVFDRISRSGVTTVGVHFVHSAKQEPQQMRRVVSETRGTPRAGHEPRHGSPNDHA